MHVCDMTHSCVPVRVCVPCPCVHACVRACMRVCVHMYVCVRVCVYVYRHWARRCV